jgi:hypothetical protein
MALDASEIQLALNQHLYVAPVGTAMPTDVSTALPAAWIDVGYIGEDSASINPSVDTEEIRAAQSLYAVRRVVTGRAFTLSLTLLQRNAETLKMGFGGGTVETTGGVSTYTPPSAGELYERAFVFEVEDGEDKARFCLYKGMPSLSGEISFARADTGYELEIQSLPTEGGLWKLVTNETGVAV